MKIKPSEKGGGVVVQLGPAEERLPSADFQQGKEALPVFKLRRILVPVDFSHCSKKALKYAIPFAEQFDAELTLLHLVQRHVESAEALVVPIESVEEIQKDLETLRATIGDAVPSRALVRMGDPAIGIIAVAKELKIDLIILSTHGRTGLERVLLGSTAEKVVRHAGCPVLIVREHEHEFVGGPAAASA